MEDSPAVSATEPKSPPTLAALISGSPASGDVVRAAETLSRALGVTWEAIFVETPETDLAGAAGSQASEALDYAARHGGTVATVAAATIAGGICEHLQSSPAAHLVMEAQPARRWRDRLQPSPIENLLAREPDLLLHILPSIAEPAREATPLKAPVRMTATHYAVAAVWVGATLLFAELLHLFIPARSLDLVFLLPVIAIAARYGLRPALFGAMLSVLAYNFFLLAPSFRFDPAAPQNLVMAAVLFGVAAYTTMVTGQLRGRLILSDRSARDNASLAALAQRLTREADWESTAATLCEHVHGLFDLNAAVFRERNGTLVITGAAPREPVLGPVDRAALEWCHGHAEEAGAGTARISSSDWQFHPLTTSLGQLAVLGIARDDGAEPVRPDQRVLLSTIIAQAALAHERLRLEDEMRRGQP